MTTTIDTITRTSSATRLAIGEVALRVRDLDRMALFYRNAIGLQDVPAAGGAVGLGAGGRRLLTLVGDPAAPLPGALAAGLFHTALLLPSRADLAAWLAHAVGRGLTIDGASDHVVSEAIYLSDPEGNGIEVYADRAAGAWRWTSAGVAMDTRPLDCRGLLATARSGPVHVMPAGTRVGHVHLKVGDTIEAEAFWTAALGMEVTSRRPGAVFMAADRYHHHLAANSWMSRGAGPRDPEAAGLMWFSVTGRELPEGGVADRWGNRAVAAF